MERELRRSIMVTDETHKKLTLTLLEKYGTTTVRFNDCIDEMCDEVLEGENQ